MSVGESTTPMLEPEIAVHVARDVEGSQAAITAAVAVTSVATVASGIAAGPLVRLANRATMLT